MQGRLSMWLVRIIVGSLLMAGCTPASKINPTRRRADKGAEAAKTGSSDLNLQFDDSSFIKYRVGKENLSFRFLYHGVDLKGVIVFQGNQGLISMSGLPTNKAADIKLEIYAASALKMVGRVPNVTLQSGPNAVSVADFTVDGIEINAGWDGKSFQGNHNWKVEGI